MIMLKKWTVKNQHRNNVIAFCEATVNKYAYSFDNDVVTIAIPSRDYEEYITRFMDCLESED